MRLKLLLMKAAAAGVLFLIGAFASDAQARVRCSYSGPPTNRLTVRAGGSEFAEARRDGSEIVVGELLERPSRCSGGTPTVLNTDTIKVVARGDASFDLRLGGGPFAPGATPEPLGAPEIEVQVLGDALVDVVGTSGGDEFHWGPGGATPGLNLNPRSTGDQDVDVTASGSAAFIVANGGRGNDTIITAPGGAGRGDIVFSTGGRGDDLLIDRNTGGILEGESGNDILIGGRPGDSLSGGPGRDRVEGRGGGDGIRGGPGRDLLLGGPGNDHIRSRDKSRDRVRCGRGRDKARADRRDRLRGCEVTRRR
jgi:Ca2+-binding RTX toxin-like protein